MQYDYIIEVCKENPYRDPETGRFTFAPGGKNAPETVPDDDTDVIIEIGDSRGLEPIKLSMQEYAMVVSELNTYLTTEERNKFILTKRIGSVKYTFENHGFGNYRFLDRISGDDDDVEITRGVIDDFEGAQD